MIAMYASWPDVVSRVQHLSRRREKSRRGTHECVRHIGISQLFTGGARAGCHCRLGVLNWSHLNLDFHGLAAAAEGDSFEWRDVRIVAAPGQGDVAIRGDQVVGRVKAGP